MLSLVVAAAAAAAAACEGDQGPAGPAGPPGGVDPDAPALDKLYAGLGGRDAIAGLERLKITASGERLMPYQGYAPEDDSIPISTYTAEIEADLARDRLRVGYARTIPAFGANLSYRVIVNGDLAATDGQESAFGFPAGALPSDRWASTLRAHRLLNPHALLREVALGERTATDRGLAVRDGELRHRIEISDEVGPISLYVDRYTGELTELATLENDYVVGDASLEVFYAGWRTWDESGVRLPSEVFLTLDRQVLHTERRTAVAVNPPLDDARFAFPAGTTPQYIAADAARGVRNSQFHEGFGAFGVPQDGPQEAITAQQVAPGVHHLRGTTHHALVVEQASGVVVVEAPLYEERAQALYAWIAANIPGKPVTHLVLSHHHADHVGALRTFAARGARIVVGEAAVPHHRATLRAARTVDPDELVTNPRAVAIDPVRIGGELTIPDAQRPVRAIHIPSRHAIDMLLVYVGNARVLFVSDIYSPGLPGNPANAREVLDAIVARNLTVDAIAGGHGGVGTRAQLEAAANP